MAGPAIVMQPALQSFLFRACLLVYGMDLGSIVLPQILQGSVIGLWPAFQGIYQRRAGRSEIQHADRAAIFGGDQGRVLVRSKINLVTAIGVEVESQRFRIFPSLMLQSVGD